MSCLAPEQRTGRGIPELDLPLLLGTEPVSARRGEVLPLRAVGHIPNHIGLLGEREDGPPRPGVEDPDLPVDTRSGEFSTVGAERRTVDPGWAILQRQASRAGPGIPDG